MRSGRGSSCWQRAPRADRRRAQGLDRRAHHADERLHVRVSCGALGDHAGGRRGPGDGDFDHRHRHLPNSNPRPGDPRIGQCDLGAGVRAGSARLGLIAAARKGWTEELIMRMSDFTFAFPAVLSAIMLAAVAGPGMVTSITAIGIFQIPTLVRVTRGSANAIWAREFVLAARASG